MGSRHATIVVETRLLFREGFKALLAESIYQIVSDFASSAELAGSPILIEPQLVILSTLAAETAVIEAVEIRKLLPTSKIVLLYGSVSLPDFEKVRQSPIDGCLPSSVSFETLIDPLALIVAGNARAMLLSQVKRANGPRDRVIMVEPAPRLRPPRDRGLRRRRT